jgi:hypothetical protein
VRPGRFGRVWITIGMKTFFGRQYAPFASVSPVIRNERRLNAGLSSVRRLYGASHTPAPCIVVGGAFRHVGL